MTRRVRMLSTCVAAIATALVVAGTNAETVPVRGISDPRVRTLAYNPDDVIRLTGFVGYQIHFEFAPGETFINLGAGDRDGIDVGKEGSHLFIKPKVERVGTNVTLLTNRRAYHLHYTALRRTPNPQRDDLVYSVRFTYPQDEAREEQARRERAAREAEAIAQAKALEAAAAARARNEAYEFCGDAVLKPVAAYDDGVHTRLRFAARTEMPAIFLKNDDGTESLTNLTVDREEVVLHRVARQWVLRRGKLVGCVRNTTYDGEGVRLTSGTVHPAINRALRTPDQP